jgi:hypothetical protein
MKLAVGTRPANRAGVVDRVAEPKQLRRRTGRFYGTSRIPAKNSRLFFNVRFWARILVSTGLTETASTLTKDLDRSAQASQLADQPKTPDY